MGDITAMIIACGSVVTALSAVLIPVLKYLGAHKKDALVLLRNDLLQLYAKAKERNEQGLPVSRGIRECWHPTFERYKKRGGNGLFVSYNDDLKKWGY
jgi:hypothetical protein